MVLKLLSCALASFCLTSSLGMASEVSKFVEDNDLWKQDAREEASNITNEMFNKIIDAAMALYTPIASARNETLLINKNWDDATVNANCSRAFGYVQVNMYGGLARRSEITPDGFAMVLCHELGHAYGGTPYLMTYNQMSAEGQSDYYSAKTCIETVLPSIVNTVVPTATPYIENTCTTTYGATTPEHDMCVRQLVASQSLGTLLSVIKKEAVPNFETPDPTIVPRTLTSYPATVQCRLDTYRAGTLDLARPACWFKN